MTPPIKAGSFPNFHQAHSLGFHQAHSLGFHQTYFTWFSSRSLHLDVPGGQLLHLFGLRQNQFQQPVVIGCVDLVLINPFR